MDLPGYVPKWWGFVGDVNNLSPTTTSHHCWCGKSRMNVARHHHLNLFALELCIAVPMVGHRPAQIKVSDLMIWYSPIVGDALQGVLDGNTERTIPECRMLDFCRVWWAICICRPRRVGKCAPICGSCSWLLFSTATLSFYVLLGGCVTHIRMHISSSSSSSSLVMCQSSSIPHNGFYFYHYSLQSASHR